MLKQQKIFFDFLRFCIGPAKEIPGSLKEVDWKELYAIAQKQALLGVLFHGIQRLPKELAPEQKLLMQCKCSFTFAPGITKAKVG